MRHGVCLALTSAGGSQRNGQFRLSLTRQLTLPRRQQTADWTGPRSAEREASLKPNLSFVTVPPFLHDVSDTNLLCLDLIVISRFSLSSSTTNSYSKVNPRVSPMHQTIQYRRSKGGGKKRPDATAITAVTNNISPSETFTGHVVAHGLTGDYRKPKVTCRGLSL
ncbi:hypothetical protein J6590_053344 [Homalodisca vitripennis]|nr:hypothetical protein J6590_053344 [Homalodisca vitripennis]